MKKGIKLTGELNANECYVTSEYRQRLVRENLERLKAYKADPSILPPLRYNQPAQRDYKPRQLFEPIRMTAIAPPPPARPPGEGEGGGSKVRAKRTERVMSLLDELENSAKPS